MPAESVRLQWEINSFSSHPKNTDLRNLFHYNRHSSNINRSYVAVYINYEATIFSAGTSKRSPSPKTYKKSYYFFAKTLDFFASLLYHGEVLKRNIMNINRLRYRRGKREWNGL